MFNTAGPGWVSDELDDGATKSIDNGEVPFTADRQEDNTLAVKFAAREEDTPFGITNYNDLNTSAERMHTFSESVGWTNLDPGQSPRIEMRME